MTFYYRYSFTINKKNPLSSLFWIFFQIVCWSGELGILGSISHYLGYVNKNRLSSLFLDFFSNYLLEYAGGRWREALENYSGLAEVSWLVDRVFFGNGGLDFSSCQQER